MATTTSSGAAAGQQHSGYSSYSPISTLERQYAAPVGQRVLLFVQTSAECCVPGGVETLLKVGSLNKHSVQPVAPQPVEQQFSNTGGGSLSNATNDKDDPFSFLSSSDAGSNDPPSSISSNGTSPNKKKKKTFMQRVKQTTKHIERGMTGLAIKVDKGRNPDWMFVGLYDTVGNILYAMSDSIPHLSTSEAMTFGIPLVIPPHLVQNNDPSFTIKLWIRSGAALLKQTNAAKSYLIGQVHLTMGQLQTCLSKTGPTNNHAFLTLPLQSHIVVNGQVSLCLVADNKFPPLCGRGWSLTDPDMSGYVAGNNKMNPLFHWPLDQSYGFYQSNNKWLVATERCIESTVVLSLATAYAQLAKEACQISLQHATAISEQLVANRHDSLSGNNAGCSVDVGYLLLDPQKNNRQVMPFSASISIHWQRPDCIFEVELLPPTKIPIHAKELTFGNFQPVVSFPFYAKICTDNILPAILAQYAGQTPPSFLLGNVRLQIRIQTDPTSLAGSCDPFAMDVTCTDDPFAPVSCSPSSPQLSSEEEIWEATFGLESYMNKPLSNVKIPVCNTLTGESTGFLVLGLEVLMNQQQMTTTSSPSVAASSAQGGLVSLVGLDTLIEDSGVSPCLDYDPIPATAVAREDPAKLRRRSQLGTMGNFITHTYHLHHVSDVQTLDYETISVRYQQYLAALSLSAAGTHEEEEIASHQDKTPKPFRPSSSRMDDLLSGIGFNIHVQSLSLNVMEETVAVATGGGTEAKGALFHNVTCGAPADHARGYGTVSLMGPTSNSVMMSPTSSAAGASSSANTASSSSQKASSPIGTISGGLRRLEAKRLELAKALVDAQSALISAAGQYLGTARARGVNHIPARHVGTASLRWKVFECMHALHGLTWMCAVRRTNVFSQALGIAISSYLTSISDVAKVQAGWPDLWVRHGYLMTFEGLLSAAGKELGMIEDASVGISMLRMVHIVLVPANNDANSSSTGRVPVPHSPYLKYVDMKSSGKGSQTQYRLEIGVDPMYYEQRIPEPLKNGASVQLYPLLYQVGVDIRQWGAHAGANVKNQISGSSRTDSSNDLVEAGAASGGGGLLDDEDDDVGTTDNDVLIALNYEAIRKMNTYAHMITPVAAGAPGTELLENFPGSNASSSPASQVHPILKTLHERIMSSAGKMAYGILDEASMVAQKLGGGGAVFCKSGKDRTAMHVSYKAAKFLNTYRHQMQPASADAMVAPTVEDVYADATTMRIYGTRLPICEKNVGQAKYAFNSLQVKFMPDMLKPPPSTLAGFLKGGRVFSREGAIES